MQGNKKYFFLLSIGSETLNIFFPLFHSVKKRDDIFKKKREILNAVIFVLIYYRDNFFSFNFTRLECFFSCDSIMIIAISYNFEGGCGCGFAGW
jgi:hypothetical protein